MKPCKMTDVQAHKDSIAYSYIDEFTGKKMTVIHLYSRFDRDSKYLTGGGFYNGSIIVDAESVSYVSPMAFA